MTRTEGDPHDRLTALCNVGLEAIKADPCYADGMKAIVMLHDDGRGGIGLGGYESDHEAVVDLLIHLKGVFEANGQRLVVMPLGKG